jgi:hypothetical protein
VAFAVSSFNLFLRCVQIALFNCRSILDHAPSRVVGWDIVMCLDTGTIFKRPVLCSHCNEDYLFTLRAIANNPVLRCHGCGGSISLRDRVYEPLLRDVRNTLQSVDSFHKLTMSQPAA